MSAPEPLRIYPLGGLGEVGMNAMAFAHGDDVLLVDCGVKFPERGLGADVIHPDFTWLEREAHRLRAVVLTHGHEDHIGALPYLLRRVRAPIYGPPYALTLAADRIAEHRDVVKPDLRPTQPGKAFRVGHAFQVEPIRVTHSIADATSLLIQTPVGQVLHTGDFKIDPASPDGAVFDEARFQRAGDDGVRLLLSDSTNAWAPGSTGSEEEVSRALEPRIASAPARVVVTIFASNVHRLIAAFQIAETVGRRVCLLGRSVHKHVEAATHHKYLRDFGHRLVTPAEAMELPRKEVLFIATGTKGEARAALARLGRGQHPEVTLEPGDRVILSSRIIPGNDLPVYRMMNDLLRRGIEVEFALADRGLHVSGHAHAGEQQRMIELTRPRAFVPVHGTLLQLTKHAELAKKLGVSETLVVENGTVIEVGEDTVANGGPFPSGIVYANGPFEIPEIVLDERAEIAETGYAVVVVGLDRRGDVVGAPEVTGRGVLGETDRNRIFDAAGDYVADEIEALPRRDRRPDTVREAARAALRRYLGRKLGTRPATDAIVVEMD